MFFTSMRIPCAVTFKSPWPMCSPLPTIVIACVSHPDKTISACDRSAHTAYNILSFVSEGSWLFAQYATNIHCATLVAYKTLRDVSPLQWGGGAPPLVITGFLMGPLTPPVRLDRPAEKKPEKKSRFFRRILYDGRAWTCAPGWTHRPLNWSRIASKQNVKRNWTKLHLE